MFEAETANADPSVTDLIDRRRPGRLEVSPALEALLRNPVGNGIVCDDFAERWAPRQPVAPSRGVLLAVALCLPVWLALGGLLYSLVW